MLQTSLVRFFRVRLTSGKLRSPKRMAALMGAVRKKSLLEKGTADECEHTVARRMGEVNSALETCVLRQNAGKLVILPNLWMTVENRKFSRRMQEYQIKAPPMQSMGAEIDLWIWATNRAWRERESSMECGKNRKVPYKIKRTLFRGAGLTALLLHDRDYFRLQRCLEKKLRALMLGTALVAAGASCIRALCTKAQMVPEHCKGARTSCTSSMLLVWPYALRIARHTH